MGMVMYIGKGRRELSPSLKELDNKDIYNDSSRSLCHRCVVGTLVLGFVMDGMLCYGRFLFQGHHVLPSNPLHTVSQNTFEGVWQLPIPIFPQSTQISHHRNPIRPHTPILRPLVTRHNKTWGEFSLGGHFHSTVRPNTNFSVHKVSLRSSSRPLKRLFQREHIIKIMLIQLMLPLY